MSITPRRANPRGCTTAWGQVQHQLRGAADFLLLDLGVRGTFPGVGRIGIDFGNRATIPQEVERELQVAGIPVGEATEEPIFTRAPGDRDEMHRVAAQHTRLVPARWHLADEREVLLPAVAL